MEKRENPVSHPCMVHYFQPLYLYNSPASALFLNSSFSCPFFKTYFTSSSLPIQLLTSPATPPRLPPLPLRSTDLSLNPNHTASPRLRSFPSISLPRFLPRISFLQYPVDGVQLWHLVESFSVRSGCGGGGGDGGGGSAGVGAGKRTKCLLQTI